MLNYWLTPTFILFNFNERIDQQKLKTLAIISHCTITKNIICFPKNIRHNVNVSFERKCDWNFSFWNFFSFQKIWNLNVLSQDAWWKKVRKSNIKKKLSLLIVIYLFVFCIRKMVLIKFNFECYQGKFQNYLSLFSFQKNKYFC